MVTGSCPTTLWTRFSRETASSTCWERSMRWTRRITWSRSTYLRGPSSTRGSGLNSVIKYFSLFFGEWGWGRGGVLGWGCLIPSWDLIYMKLGLMFFICIGYPWSLIKARLHYVPFVSLNAPLKHYRKKGFIHGPFDRLIHFRWLKTASDLFMFQEVDGLIGFQCNRTIPVS